MKLNLKKNLMNRGFTVYVFVVLKKNADNYFLLKLSRKKYILDVDGTGKWMLDFFLIH